MIGGLAQFGVLGPAKLIPEKCLFESGLGTCNDKAMSFSQDKVNIILTNSLGRDIYVREIITTVT
jgi:hypothetical protein